MTATTKSICGKPRKSNKEMPITTGANTKSVRRQALTPADRRLAQSLLAGKYECMHNPVFGEPDAYQRVFDDVPQIRSIDTSWYVPALERLSDTPTVGPSVTLLNPEQEKALFLQYNFCRYRVVQVRDEIGNGRITANQTRAVLQWHQKAQECREQLANANLALVLAMIKRMKINNLDFTEQVSEGNMAILRAIDKFDVARGFKFSTYACRVIIKALSRASTRAAKSRRITPVSFDPDFEQSDHAERKRAQHESDCADELRQIIRENLASLTPVEHSIIVNRFAIQTDDRDDADRRGLTLNEVGSLIGLTKERVRQIQNQAMTKIRSTLERHYLT